MRDKLCLLICLCMYGLMNPLPGQTASPDTEAIYPAAVFAFQERSASLAGYGEKVSELLFVTLAENPKLLFVDRQEMNKILDEHELNLSGMVNPDQAVKIGALIGAKILITGSVMQMDNKIYLVAKIIGTETSRVIGASASGSAQGEIFPLVQELATAVSEKISSQSDSLVAKPVPIDQRIAKIKAELGDRKRPSVSISVQERHVGQMTIDPAAETELIRICREAGFTVIDSSVGNAKAADITISGEGFSEFGARRKNIVSVKARLEIKSVDKHTGQIIVADRQTAVEVDLTEQIAGKKALQSAAAIIAERLLPKLVK